MSVNDQLDKLQRSLLDFFFPRRCPFCGRVVGKALLCETCEKELPYSREVRTGTFGRCAAPLYYEGAVREAILSFKFKGRTEALDCFGSLMARTAAQEFSGEFDAVTWVPVSAKRLRKRGFDQARYLCASLCVLGVYEPVSPADIAGKRFLLVDDILTTGATLGECVRVLKAAGAADVVCLTLAMTPPQP